MQWILLLVAIIPQQQPKHLAQFDSKFATEASCLAHVETFKPHVKQIASDILPPGIVFDENSLRFECRLDGDDLS